MTHPGILKVNEFFNNKLSKTTDKIKISVTYTGNFGNANLFNNFKKIIKSIGYEDIKGQIDTIYCIVDALKTDSLSTADQVMAMSADSKTYTAARDLIWSIKDFMKTVGKISFDDRIRRDAAICIYLDSTSLNIQTNYFTLAQQKHIYKKLIGLFVSYGMFICKSVEYKVDSADFYQAVYDNAKSVMSNMSSRGMSAFAIACHFWKSNKNVIPKPFLHNWSNTNFIQSLMTTPIYQSDTSDEVKSVLKNSKVCWAVLSELSLLTDKVANIDDKRRGLNLVINGALRSEGETFLKDFLTRIKLVASQNVLKPSRIGFTRDIIRTIEKELQGKLKEQSTLIPAKEEIIDAIKFQFTISRILDVDFSSKRKDHLVLDKVTRKRVFDIL